MSEEFWPESYSDHPLYNIKAVEQATGLSSATLRAWERRYGVCAPQRSDSGYRLYSDRDIAMLRWLKRRVDEGITISQAVAMLNLHASQQVKLENGNGNHRPVAQAVHEHPSQGDLRHRLTHALLDFDEQGADAVLSESFALHGVETSCERVIAPVLVDLGERWHRGEISVVAEHFATHYLRRKLDGLVNLTPIHAENAPIVMGCAPGDWHEIGLVLLSFYLRRQGYHVIYLGQNVPPEHLVNELERLRPVLVVMSAATSETAHNLAEVSQIIATMPEPRPQFGYGGRAYNKYPELRTEVAGSFLGESAFDAVARIHALVQQAGWQRTLSRSAGPEL